MSRSSPKPNVLIVGGMHTVARHFAQSLFPPNAPPLVERLRMVDKALVEPIPTAYIGPDFAEFTHRPEVDYSQVNLTLPDRLPAVFAPPDNGRPWDLVFDFLGDVGYDAMERFMKMHTYTASVNCGIEAAKHPSVKAYVRLTWGYYLCDNDRHHTEDEDLEPDGLRGEWWHETLRSLANIPNLPLVIMRAAIPYGPYCTIGLAQHILLGEIYRFKQRKMRYLWGPGLRLNTVHTDDIAGACWQAAMWMATVGRTAALSQAGEALHFHNDPEKLAHTVPPPIPPEQVPRAVLFNLVDAGDTTQASLGRAIAEVFNISIGYRYVPDDITMEEMDIICAGINNWHGAAWQKLCEMNDPPMEYPWLQAWLDTHDLLWVPSSWDGSKLARIVQYQLKRPQLTAALIRQIVDLWKEDGTLPRVNAVDPSDSDSDDEAYQANDDEEGEGEEEQEASE